MEEKIYTSSAGEKIPVEKLGIFQLVNGLIKNVSTLTNDSETNIVVLKDELLKRLAPKETVKQKIVLTEQEVQELLEGCSIKISFGNYEVELVQGDETENMA